MKTNIIRIFALVLLTACVFYMAACSSRQQPQEGTSICITVPEGATTAKIAEILLENGLIKSERKFISAVTKSEYDGKLQAGDFELVVGMPVDEMIEGLATGSARVQGRKLTVPEGFSAEMIAKRAEELGICTEQDFLEALFDEYDYSFLSEIPTDSSIKYRLQGFLFPSTYEVADEVTAHEIVDMMLGEFERQYGSLAAPSTSHSLYEIMTIASLIERESVLEEERPIIAGVIENRLEADMPLQIDATVIYAVSDGRYDMDAVYYSHLEAPSPYNTYKYRGLPAGPICNPGLASIKAALAPESHDYLYYHTDEDKKDGSHIFTKTLAEHNATM